MPATADLFGVRILFIGNSYTSRNHLPQLVTRLAAAADSPTRVETGMIVAGGASLRRHWNAGVALKTLAGSPWNYVVLQEQSTLPLKNAARYHDNVRLFDAEIARHGARTVLYLTWSREQSPDTQASINRAVEDIAAEIDALVVPVGPAWHAAMAEDRDLRLYTDDGSHPTEAGSYLAACVFHVSLFGQVPERFSVSDALRIDRGVAATLHGIAGRFRPRP
jgi:lysophospholipase L1-like esterase